MRGRIVTFPTSANGPKTAESTPRVSLLTLPKVLLVDDNADSIVALTAILEAPDRQLLSAQSGRDALRLLLEHDFAAIVMDVKMPGMDGFETASVIRSRRRSENTPILFLTGFRDDDHLVRGYGLRAVDFLFKPIAAEVLSSKISTFVALANTAALLQKQSQEIHALNAELEGKVAERTVALRAAIDDAKAARVEADAANEAKSRFVAHLSHELRTPLNAVIGYTEMMEEDANDRGLTDFLPDIRKLRHAANHLASLINDVLDLSKIEAGKMDLSIRKFAVRAVVDDVVATSQPLIERNENRLQVSCTDGSPVMNSDPVKLRQVLLNLISNAARFTTKGTISLEVRHDDRFMCFRVKDTGLGMTQAQIEKLFLPFSQLHEARHAGGTGLGLVITLHLCRIMGGEIKVESEVGQGSSFTVSLPANFAQQAHAA